MRQLSLALCLQKQALRWTMELGPMRPRRTVTIMTTTTKNAAMSTLTKVQDEYFTLIKRVEAPVVRYAGEMAKTMARYVPERPPFMAKVPTVAELVDNQLKFRKQFVEEQTMFVRKMMKAMEPTITKMDTVAQPMKPTIHMPAKGTTHKPTASRRVTHKAA